MKYYAIIGPRRTAENPSGIARRRVITDDTIDEALRRDLTWQPDSAIAEWEHGDVGAELVEITEAEAEQLIERFREKWADQN